MGMKIFNEKEKEEIVNKLHEQHGIKSIPGVITQRGEERLFLFLGDFSAEDIREIEKYAFIERIGIYFAKVVGPDIKLSLEGSQILAPQITKNVIDLDAEQTEEWMKGHELPIQTGKYGFVVLRHGSDFLGAGKASEKKIGNFVPKNRRLKEKSLS